MFIIFVIIITEDQMESDPGDRRAGYKVLVLNSTLSPINITSWRRAILLLIKEKAETVEPSNRLVNNKFILPLVIRLKKYIPLPFSGVVLSRKNIFLRDNYICQYCGRHGDLTIDHVIPRSKGGQDSWTNAVVCCVRCNNKKGDKTPEETGMKLGRTPYKPPSMLYLHMTRMNNVPEVWNNYFFSLT
jgi:5-methylcytosine-specific restriction endonuclease McrA